MVRPFLPGPLVFDKETGEQVKKFGRRGCYRRRRIYEDGYFGLMVWGERLYVSDTWNSRIQIFEADGLC